MRDVPAELFPSAAWYHRNYPQGADVDPRCFEVLATWTRLYNVPRTGKGRLDGGFRKCGNGLEVHIYCGGMSTYDDNGLTRLVVAAHEWLCRVEIRADRNFLVLCVHPRKPASESDRFTERHPSLADLVEQCIEVAAS